MQEHKDSHTGWPAGFAKAGVVLRPGLVARSGGGLADVRALTRADLSPSELGWALSGVMRWGARARKERRHYPVALHCMHVASIALEYARCGLSGTAPRWLWLAALLHDAPEAYIGDPPSPLGAMPEFAGVKALLAAGEAAVCAAYDLPLGALAHPLVKRADRAAGIIEAHALVEGSEAWAVPLESLELPAHLLRPMPAVLATVPQDLAAVFETEVRQAYFAANGCGWGAP